ncbi:hypothetical protein HY338_03855 [Candidatus Gottesmanbacteria bacterium]|nr:hypothetical protein [Candidatus Gottesmanbacteria bacterium]
MLDERFVLLGVLLNVVGGLDYFIKTIQGRVKPNRVTWFLWALIAFIAFAAEINQGVGMQSLLTFMVGFNPLLIFIASYFNKNSVWKIKRLDIICAALSLAGLLFWMITKVGNIAIIFSIIADAFAGIPTVIKSYRDPVSEDYKIFMFGMVSAIITLLTVKQWDLANYGFPLYIFSINILLTILIRFKLGIFLKTNLK